MIKITQKSQNFSPHHSVINQKRYYCDMKINFTAIKDKFRSFRPIDVEHEDCKDFVLLDHIEKIVEFSQKYGIKKCLTKGKIHFDSVTQKLNINPVQAVLFSHFLERSDDARILTSEIAQAIKCSKVRIIKYLNESDDLAKKKLIRCCREDGRISFRVPLDVRESLRKLGEYKPENRENLSIEKFFVFLKRLFNERENRELSCLGLILELTDLISSNMHLQFCRKMTSYNLNENNLVLLACFCHLAVNNNDDNIYSDNIAFLFYEDESESLENAIELRVGSHTLIEGKFIEFNNTGGFVNSESWRLSGRVKNELLSEIKTKWKKNYKKDMILFKDIKAKKMCYNEKEAEEIKKFTYLLQEENFKKIQKRFSSKNMRKGFICLFSGGPGTGKTETVYQIARNTKRNIMAVDISAAKSCWYGETEKIVKQIFDKYRTAVANSKITPILLFNEADGIIGKRRINSGDSHSIDQTENTIQNIILQEMENLNGILIATTNLAQNMDSAF
ncbi:MAG: AAA family ATPase, partial [Treponema sp.]|nr:AAA family ATPase [Treponema sp.]